MSTTNVDRESESRNVRFSIVGIEKNKRTELSAGAHTEETLPFEGLEGKKASLHQVVRNDNGIIWVMYRKDGNVNTITYDEIVSKRIAEGRRIKGSRAVPAKKVKDVKSVPAKKAKGPQEKGTKAKGDGR